MGISELESYVKHCLKDGIKEVMLEKEVEEFRR